MRRGAERSDGRCPARGDVRGAGGGGRAGTGAARTGQLLQAGERLPARAEASAAAPAPGSPPARCGIRGDCLAAGTAPGSPEPIAIKASWARARTERRREGGKLREAGGSAASISAPSDAGLREQGGAAGRGECAGQGRARTVGRTRGHGLGALRCCPHTGSCPPEPFRFTSAALPAHLGWFLSERDFAVFPPPRCQGEGHVEEGDINWSSLKICRAWDDLDYRRVESSNFPSITT